MRYALMYFSKIVNSKYKVKKIEECYFFFSNRENIRHLYYTIRNRGKLEQFYL